MSTQGNGAPRPFSVHMAQAIRAQVVELHARALSAGAGQRFVAAFKTVVERLRSDPLVFGEELYYLPALKLHIRQAVVTPVVVDYAVHSEKPLVFIRGIKVLS